MRQSTLTRYGKHSPRRSHVRQGLSLICAGMLVGCTSPPERLYILPKPEAVQGIPPATAPSAHGSGAARIHIVVGPVHIPDSVDRPQLVVRESAVRVVALEQERWGEPLREAVSRELTENIALRIPSASVANASTAAPISPDLRVIVDIERFEATPGKTVLIEAHWWLRAATERTARESPAGAAGQNLPEGSSTAEVPVRGGPKDYDALVGAEAVAIGQIGAELSRDLEAAIHSP